MLVIACVSYVGLKAPWLFHAIAYLMSLQFWGEGKLHVTISNNIKLNVKLNF
jgi:hypothetical protein